MAKFRKKPVVIEAAQYRGGNSYMHFPPWLSEAVGAGTIRFYPADNHCVEYLTIATLEGVMEADPEDWIIKGIAGEIYPCKPDIFAATYDPVDGGAP